MSIKNNIKQLVQSLADRSAARERWLTLTRERSDGQYEARCAHLALDEQVEENYGSLTETLTVSQSGGTLEFDLDELDRDEFVALRRLLSERGLLELMEPARPETLSELVDAWRQAGFTLEAAGALDKLRMSVEADELPTAISGTGAAYRADRQDSLDGKIGRFQEEAWNRAVASYQALRARMAGDSQDVDAGKLNGDATFQNARNWLKRYDDLREQLQTMVERLQENNALSFELEELEADARRALINAIDGGLCRQRQLAPQPKAQPRYEVDTMTQTGAQSDLD